MEGASSINRSIRKRRGEDERKREMEERKERERRKERKKKEKEKKERKRKEAGGFFLSSLAFRWSKLVEQRSKVQRFDEWVTLQEVEILPTLVYICMFDKISQDALVICLCDATKPVGPYT